MTRYTGDSRDRVRDAVDMLALVGGRVDLRRAGVDSYFGLCPFHEERTPSFHVRPDEKHYHCFGCQASGDPFTFVMETEGLDFVGALELLAERFGVRLETEAEDPAAAERRARHERLYALLDRAAGFYSRYLWEAREAGPAREYLLGRGLSEPTLREFRVGYAPAGWDKILAASRSAGYTEEELLAVGLISRAKTGRLYDRFRERVLFPAVDARGRVHGFGARAMRPDQPPKYLNTSDGELYHKRSQLFGIDLARAPGARAGRMILVEGYTDVLALHQAGLRNTVAIMGTSLTEEQVRILERTVQTLVLCLDADRAGQDAMLRAAQLAAGRSLELRVVPLPAGADPADIAERDGPDALRALVDATVPFVSFHVERILERAELSSAEGKDRALAELRPALVELPLSILRDELMRRVAGALELTEARLATLLAAEGRGAGSAPSGGPEPAAGAPAAAPGVPRRTEVHRNEESFLALCLAVPEAGEELLGRIDPAELFTVAALRRAARQLTGRLAAPLTDLPEDDDDLARTVAGLVALAGRGRNPTPDALEHAHLVLELARLERTLVRRRAEGGAGMVDLAREREGVQERIRGVVARLERAV